MTFLLASRQLIEVVPEAKYGVDPGTPGPFLAYPQEGEWPNLRWAQAEVARARRGYGGARLRQTELYGELNPIRTYLFEGDTAWTRLLEASGFVQRNPTTWEARPTADHTSLTIRHYIDAILALLTGCRGSLTLRAQAGAAISLEASLSGTMTEDARALPVRPLTRPTASKFCAADLEIEIEGVGIRRPTGLEDLTIETGTAIAQKIKPSGRVKWRVENVTPSLRCQIDETVEARWASDRDKRIWARVTTGQWRWSIGPMQIADPPARVRQSSGLTGVALLLRSVASGDTPCSVQWQGA